MDRTAYLSLFAVASLACCAPLVARAAVPATSPSGDSKTAHIILGQSAVPLYGPWKFTVGDSPIDPKTGKPLWAEPDFDDTSWETVDLKPKNEQVDPISGISSYVPGWTVHGHPGYWGYAWYRIHVSIQAPHGQSLALAGPSDFDDVFQVFADGDLIGHFGNFNSALPSGYYSQPTMFALPASTSSSTSSAEDTKNVVIAYRDFMLPSTLTEIADVGGFHNAPILGDTATVRAGYTMSWLELVRSYAVGATLIPISAVIALMAFTLILFDRSDKVYLLIGWLFLIQAASQVLNSAGTFTQWMTITTSQLLNDGFLTALIYTGWVIVWWVWFGRQRPSWTPWAAAGLGLLFFVTLIVGQEIIVGLVPHRVASAFLSASVVVRLLFLALQLMIVFRGIRRQGLESWLVLPAVLLWSVNSFSNELVLVHIRIRWDLLGLSIRLGTISGLLLVIVVALLLLRRLLTSIENQRQMALDVKQAQEVQQMILPEALTTLPGLVLESEYIPAREVGGDFFQTIPNPVDNSLLIVAGDVAGKGLQAGMLVALLVGAIRTAASHNTDPRYVLGELNERLLGRKNAQATCLALRIGADGAVTIANAGHMPPYLNGELVHIEGSLPLGMVTSPEFSFMRFNLRENDKLFLISDGVVEAMDEEGRLYGFDRVFQLLQSSVSASQVAHSAKVFGQQDDISVISITCTAVVEPALA